ncbi:MAG: START-like domain-containing protein [Bacteroidia bacterium]
MSKKSKGSSAKKSTAKKTTKVVNKKAAPKKAVKKAAKPVAKKKTVVKKPVKKVIAKKSKPQAKKPVKKAAPKKVLLKKALPKTVKAAVKSKPVAKKATADPKAKKVAAQKPVKALKPAIDKKPVATVKPAPKKAEPLHKIEKPVEKPAKVATEAKADHTKVLAITNTIPKQEVQSLSLNKIASISSSITNPIKKNDSYSIKPEKEPNGKYELEIPVRSSPEMLFEFLSTPSGLSEWFCDDVNIRNGIYTFIWDGQLQQARLLKTIDDQLVRFQWVDKTDGSYFEFRIQRDDLTNDISLIVTDFADSVSERESSKLLWQSQVEKLMHIIGSIF